MPEPLKNQYSQQYIERLANELKKHFTDFRSEAFIRQVLDKDWPHRELKQRMRHIVNCIHLFLPIDYKQQINVLKKVAPHFGSFTGMLFPDFVEVYGIEYPETSVPALEFFTQYSSSEFAVRPFIVRYPEMMVKQHFVWAHHKNHHVRRLASEGIRPRLPWAMALPDFKRNPSDILPILEKLKSDDSEYVRRSVANNLNDISKDHPKTVLDIAKKWKGQNKETDWIIRHACRGMLKRGDEQTMNIFGFEISKANIANLKVSAQHVKIGGAFSFEFTVKTDSPSEKLKLAYRIDFMKMNGKTSGKVFHLSELELKKAEEINIRKNHSFKNLTTRKHHPGKHALAILINGKELGSVDFELLEP